MRPNRHRRTQSIFVTAAVCIAALAASGAHADMITYSGTISYDGASIGDSLYVAALDTTGVEDVTLLGLEAYEVGPPPFDQPYSVTFDNTGVAPQLLIASFLDVDGGGVSDIHGVDVFGWYDGGTAPAAVSSASSQSGLDFVLPTGEIHGSVTFGPGQFVAGVELIPDVTCMSDGFRPLVFLFASGSYSIIGVYPGTYCVGAEGGGAFGYYWTCHGDPTCASPTPVTVGDGEVITGVDLEFSTVAVGSGTWGAVKTRFR